MCILDNVIYFIIFFVLKMLSPILASMYILDISRKAKTLKIK